jgi:hypothetical protein
MNLINSAWLRPELLSAQAQIEGRSPAHTCLDHWSLGFEYCLLFVNWCLEFFYLRAQLYLAIQL